MCKPSPIYEKVLEDGELRTSLGSLDLTQTGLPLSLRESGLYQT